MSFTVQQASVFVFFWLIHVAWMGLAIGLVALIGNRFARKAAAKTSYAWNLFCFALLGAAIVLAGGFSYLNSEGLAEVERLADSRDASLESALTNAEDSELLPNSAATFNANIMTDRDANLTDLKRGNEQPIRTNSRVQPTGQPGETVDVRKTTPPQNLKNEPVASSLLATGSSKSSLPFFAKWIAAFYVLGLAGMLIRLSIAAWGCRRLIRANEAPDASLVRLVEEASRQIGLKVVPMVRVCQRVAVPVVAGLFRPVILMPSKIAATLPAQQLHAILAHELAHIRRYDHLVVVGQRVIESVLFFHPVAWLVSRRLDCQRELCCDDLVVASGVSGLEYARSLLNVAQTKSDRQASAVAVGLAATGRSESHLVTRVGRLLGEPTDVHTSGPTMNASAAVVALVLSFVIIGGSLLLTQRSDSPLSAAPLLSPSATSLADSTTNTSNQFETLPDLSGVIVDDAGRPIGDATVIIQEHPYKYPGTRNSRGDLRTRDELSILAQVKSSMDGKFSFTDVPVPDFHTYLDTPYPVSLVVIHDDHAVTWQHLEFISKKPVEISLAKSVATSLKLETSEGNDAKDIDARLVGVMTIKDWQGTLQDQNRGEPEAQIYSGLVWSPLQDSVDSLIKQQASGFSIENMPADSIAAVRVSASGHTEQTVFLSNLSREQLELLPEISRATLLAAEMSLRLTRATTINLTILDKATKLPLEGVSCTGLAGRSRGRSDANGKLRLDRLDRKAPFDLRLEPAAETSLLGHARKIELSADKPQVDLTVELETGIPLTGRVVDAETGAGIPGAQVSFAPTLPTGANSAVTAVVTNESGEYRLIVPSVSGSVAVAGQVKDYDTFVTENQRLRVISVAVDPTQTGEAPALKLTKQRRRFVGMTVRVIGPDEKPVPNAKVRVSYYEGRKSGSQGTCRADSEGQLKIDIGGILETYPTVVLIAIDNSNSLVARREFTLPKTATTPQAIDDFVRGLAADHAAEDSSSAILLKMEPVATVRGTVLDSESQRPVSHALVHFRQKAAREYNGWDDYFPPTETDENGFYEMKAIPGIKGFTQIEHPDYLTGSRYGYQTPGAKDDVDTVHQVVSKTAGSDSKIRSFTAPSIGGLTGIEAYEMLVRQFSADQKTFRREMQETNDPVKTQTLLDRRSPYSAYVNRMLEVADTNRGDPVEAKALAWACDVPVVNTGAKKLAARYKLRTKIGNRLMADFIESPQISNCLGNLVYSQANPMAAAEKILEMNPDKSIQGNALLLIGRQLLDEIGKPLSDRSRRWRKGRTDQQLESEAHKVFTRIKQSYGDVPYWRHKNLGTIAEMQLFELDHLGVGDLAEDIQGADLDGQPMRLSSFRGKFVVLDFWGSWCGPCIGELPVLNRISKDYPDDVVVVGVMNDSLEDAREAIEQHNVDWKNWLEPDDNMPIHIRWNINSWPTTYLIGRDGKIISNRLRGDRLLERLEEVIESENAKPNDSPDGASTESSWSGKENKSGDPVVTKPVEISIVNAEGWPVSNASATVWSRARKDNKSMTNGADEGDGFCKKSLVTKSDANGKITFDSSILENAAVCVIVKTENGLAGYVELSAYSLEDVKRPQIQLAAMEQLDVVVQDYDTGDPIENCSVTVSHGGHRFLPALNILTETKVKTDANGKLTLTELIPGMITRMHLDCEGYHIFGRNSKDATLRRRNGVERPVEIELLKEDSYQRAIEAARLLLPNTEGLEPNVAFRLLVKHYERAQSRSKNAGGGALGSRAGQFMHRMRTMPSGLYRDAIIELTRRRASNPDNDVRFEAMMWLLGNYIGEGDRYRSEADRIVIELVETFSMHEKIDLALNDISHRHPEAETALENIAENHPNAAVRGRATWALVNKISSFPRYVAPWPSVKNLRKKQIRERKYVEQIIAQYDSVPVSADNTKTLGELARIKREWLNRYGIGGIAPGLFGKTLGGAQTSLSDFPEQHKILHFWIRGNEAQLRTLREIRTAFPRSIQLVGIVSGDKEKAQLTARNENIDWPVLWDSFRGTEYYRGVFSQNPALGLRWGKEHLNDFLHYRTFVIDPDGKILAAGLQGEELKAFVESLRLAK